MIQEGEKKKFKKDLKLRIYKHSVLLVQYLRTVEKNSDKILISIFDQVLRSGTSMGANYVEAIGSPSTKDFRKFLTYSLKSGNETLYWLALIRDSHIDSSETLTSIIQETKELTNILGKSVSTLYKKDL
jgi:four helix bundle protein